MRAGLLARSATSEGTATGIAFDFMLDWGGGPSINKKVY